MMRNLTILIAIFAAGNVKKLLKVQDFFLISIFCRILQQRLSATSSMKLITISSLRQRHIEVQGSLLPPIEWRDQQINLIAIL